jgi:pimeloyl-ACP methyl ester carboxylesterase
VLKTALTDTLEIAFEEVGDPSGGTVILLHGFPDDAKAWAATARGLSDAGFYTIAPYLRGFGETRFRHAETPRSGQQAANGISHGTREVRFGTKSARNLPRSKPRLPTYRDPALPSVEFFRPSLRENVASELGNFSTERRMSFFI